MGEIADDMIEGRMCSHCGCVFEDDGKVYEHGYACLCRACYETETKKERAGLPKAKAKTF